MRASSSGLNASGVEPKLLDELQRHLGRLGRRLRLPGGGHLLLGGGLRGHGGGQGVAVQVLALLPPRPAARRAAPLRLRDAGLDAVLGRARRAQRRPARCRAVGRLRLARRSPGRRSGLPSEHYSGAQPGALQPESAASS